MGRGKSSDGRAWKKALVSGGWVELPGIDAVTLPVIEEAYDNHSLRRDANVVSQA